jgi:hypothetical protein
LPTRSRPHMGHFSDMPPLTMNVGYQGKSGSDSDIAKPT